MAQKKVTDIKEVDKTKKQRIGYTIMYVLLGVSVVGFAVGLSYATRKK